MTTIALRVTKNEIQIAADNQITSNGNSNEQHGYAITWNSSEGIKLFELDNGWIFAMTGSIGEMNLFRDAAKSIDLSQIKSLRQFLKDCYEKYITDPGYCHDPGSMLVVAEGQAYQITDRHGILPINNYMALGSGCTWAMGALHQGASAVDAVLCAASFDLYTDSRVSSKVVSLVETGDFL